MKTIMTVVLLLFISTAFAAEEGVLITRGFVNAENYLATAPGERRRYVKGLVDGILVSPLLDARIEKRVIELSRCLAGATSEQLDGMILAELKSNGEGMQQSAHIAAFRVISRLCSKE